MNKINAYHNSHIEKYRKPFGAMPCGGEVALKISVSGELPESVQLRCWEKSSADGEYGEKIILMKKSVACSDEGCRACFEAKVKLPEVPSLFWYYFIIRSGGESYYYSNNSKMGGEGSLTEYPTENSFQITVYKKDFKTPEWFFDSVMYQIFPDRFYADKAPENKKREEYFLHSDWYEPLADIKHPYENGPACCDFFGGTLKGICEKLPYISRLGISVIYLNPIFESYSNHRYDTGNYKKIDPLLGNEEDFKELCTEAGKLGIKIILDGVFSHTGSDSVYFNKYGLYGDGGAYNDKNSPYKDWYSVSEDGSYESWWGCSNLPNVDEMAESYIDYILRDKDSVIKRWLRLGASGWRLDVADELPDKFLKILREEVKSEKKDAVIIGEVWEDASNKVSYGQQREYLLGGELDSVMNYPFKELAIGFTLSKISSHDFAAGIMSIAENYPSEVFYSLMNLVSTHDTMRIKTVLGEPYIPDGLSFEERQSFKLNCFEETAAIKRLKLIIFMQMTFPGVPSIYYGDEIGMQGLTDPFNRMPFTWRSIDPELLSYCRTMIAMRNENTVLRTGGIHFINTDDDILAYIREIKNSRDALGRRAENSQVICIINRSGEEKHVLIKNEEICGEYVSLEAKRRFKADGSVLIEIPPCSAEILIRKQ